MVIDTAIGHAGTTGTVSADRSTAGAPAEEAGARRRVLLCRAAGRLLALPVALDGARLVETMRPLPVRSLPGLPDHVLGAALIRGVPTPVLDLRRLLGGPAGEAGRYVTVELPGGRTVALAVDAVLDVRTMQGEQGEGVAPLLDGVERPLVTSLGTRDGELLHVLAAAHLLDDDVWSALPDEGMRR